MTDTRAHRSPPDFLILGVQKGGTTWLAHVLNRLSCMQLSNIKETRFLFARWQRGFDAKPDADVRAAYQAHWPDARDRLTFEASPGYIAHPEVADRLKRLDLSPKFVVILRDPAKRLTSVHNMWIRNRGLNTPFETYWADALSQVKALRDEIGETQEWYTKIKGKADGRVKAIAHGLYMYQLDAWFDRFPRERFFITDTSKLYELDEITRLVVFCAEETISTDEIAAAMETPIGNKSKEPPIPETQLAPFRSFFAPYNAALTQRYGIATDHWI